MDRKLPLWYRDLPTKVSLPLAFARQEALMEQVHELEGLCAIFLTREDADLAVEHLAQEYGIDPAFIYVEPVEDQNSAGVETSGGDAVSGGPSHRRRLDAALNGAIQLTVSVRQESLPLLKKALHEGRAIDIQVF